MSLPVPENRSARLANGSARLANVDGHLTDVGGHLADAGGNLTDVGGNLTNAGGHLADAGGNLTDAGGNVGAPGVWRFLDGLGNDGGLAGPDLQRLAAAWRVLLHLHDGEPGGECERCSRGHRGSCTVWQIATGYLMRRARW